MSKPRSSYQGIDILLANAGIEGVVQPITDYPIDVFDQVMAVNVRGVWLGLKYAIQRCVLVAVAASSLPPRPLAFAAP